MEIIDAVVIVGDWILEEDKRQSKGWHSVYIKLPNTTKKTIEGSYNVRIVNCLPIYDVNEMTFVVRELFENDDVLKYDTEYFEQKLNQYINEN